MKLPFTLITNAASVSKKTQAYFTQRPKNIEGTYQKQLNVFATLQMKHVN